MLRDGIRFMLGDMTQTFNERVVSAGEQVAQSPLDFNPTIMAMLQALSDNVIMPLAGLILTFLLTYELISLIMQRNNMGDVDYGLFVKWGIKLVVGVFFLANTFTIVNGIFAIGGNVIQAAAGTGGGGIGPEGNALLNLLPWVVNAVGVLIGFFGLASLGIGISQDSSAEKHKGVMAIVGGILVLGAGLLIGQVASMWVTGSVGGLDTSASLELDMGTLDTVLDVMATGQLLTLLMASTIVWLVMLGVGVVVPIIILQRFIEIYLYISLAALPMATFVNGEIGGIGKNYLKTLAAYTFQGLLIIILFHIFGALVDAQLNGMMTELATEGTAEGLVGSLFLMAGFSVLLVVAMFRAGSAAKSIFGVS